MAKPGTKPVAARVMPNDGGGQRDRALIAATVAILAPVLIQCLVSISSQVYWDVDPRSSMANIPIMVFGPAATAWFNVASILLAAAALAVHVAVGGAISWPTVILAAAGAVACVWHMPEHAENLFRCSLWLGGVALAVAGMHLASHERPRRFIAAALIAMLVPLAIKAAWFVWVEHPETVRMFMADRKAVLESQGWSVGSPQDLIYQRRLETPEVTGVFGLSNPFGSIAAAFTLVAAAGSVWLIRLRRRGPALLLLAITAMGLFTVVLSRSRGAAVATVVAILLLAALIWARKHSSIGKQLGLLGITLVAAVVLAVLLRGSHGPPASVQADRTASVYFRYQYWRGAERIMRADGVIRWLRGIGPAALQPLYSIYKDPLNPEEVTSTHNVFIDLIVMLGVGGLAWSVMLLTWLYRAGRGVVAEDVGDAGAAAIVDFQWPSNRKGRVGGPLPSGDRESPIRNPPALIAILILAGLAFGIEYAMHLPEFALYDSAGRFDLDGFFVVMIWLTGPITFILVAYWLVAADRLSTRAAGVGLFLGAIVLLIHNQIEMTFFHQGSSGVAFFIVGAAAGCCAGKRWAGRGILWHARWGVPVVIAVGALVLIPTDAVPMTIHEETLRQAADSLRVHDLSGCVDLLDRAITELPSDPLPCRWRARVLIDEAGAAAHAGHVDVAARMIQTAVETPRSVTEAVREDTGLMRAQAQGQERGAEILDDPRRLDAAAATWKRVIDVEPYGLQSHLQYADLLWRLERFDEARMVYRRVMDLDADSYLDPLRQLSERDRALVKERLSVAAMQRR